MPINDKGEFIRSSRRTAGRPASRPKPPAQDLRISRSDLIVFAKALGGFVLLAALVGLLAVYHEWILRALVLAVLAWLGNRFR